MARMNKVTAILGRRGTGKTTYLKELIESYKTALPNQKVLILDTLDHPAYREIPLINENLLKRWKKPAVYRMYSSDTDNLLSEVEKHYNNGLLILEDASKYLRRQLSDDVRRFIFDSKQKNLDIIFLFHGFMAMPKELYSIIDNLVLFKTDDPSFRKNAIMNYQEVKEVYDRVMQHPSPYYNETITIY
jgi:ABC-type uncharacterized transport system ATPase subunit